MQKKTFDLCVIGAGPGGYVAAIRAGQQGLQVALIERENFGGTCLNTGCIPTKTLISGAEVFHQFKHAEEFGINISKGSQISPDWQRMLERKNDIIGRLRNGIGSLVKAAGVTVFNGTGSFIDRNNVAVIKDGVTQDIIVAKKIIIATGSAALVPNFIPEHKRVLTSTELLSCKEIPKTILILGGGVIGCEFACLFAELGSKVTVVEMLPSILPNLDNEISRTQTQYMKKSGINILTGKPMQNIKPDKNGVTGTVGDQTVRADYLLVAIGRKPCTEGLNLAAAGVNTNERGWINVDEYCRTNIPYIYAIGDIAGRIWLAHLASAMGISAVDHILGGNHPFSYKLVPGCIFTRPEIGTVGMTEEQCQNEGIKYNVGKFPFAALGKAMAINHTEGFCKIIADAETDQVLGVHIIGPHSTDLIAEAVPAMNLEITAKELGMAIHAHPTLGEVMMEAAHAVHNESIHIPLRKKKE